MTLTFDIFDLESGVRVMCDVGYPLANFSLPRPLCSRLRPDVRERQTSDRQTSDYRRQTKALLNATAYQGGGHNNKYDDGKYSFVYLFTNLPAFRKSIRSVNFRFFLM